MLLRNSEGLRLHSCVQYDLRGVKRTEARFFNFLGGGGELWRAGSADSVTGGS